MEHNFGVLNAADAVTTSRLREGVVRAEFYPKVTPKYQRSADDSLWGLDAQQKVPGREGRVTASALMRSTAARRHRPELSPFPRTSDFRMVMTQPLLRGFGPERQLLRAARPAAAPRGPGAPVRAGRGSAWPWR